MLHRRRSFTLHRRRSFTLHRRRSFTLQRRRSFSCTVEVVCSCHPEPAFRGEGSALCSTATTFSSSCWVIAETRCPPDRERPLGVRAIPAFSSRLQPAILPPSAEADSV